MKKKISIFILVGLVTLLISGGCYLLRITFITNGTHLENVVYKTNNLIIQQIQFADESRDLVILGSGYSLNVDESNNIINHDPFMVIPYNIRELPNVNIMTIFFPFETDGLEMADKDEICSKLNFFEQKIYTLISSDHTVDRDLLVNSEFLRNVDYSGLKSCKQHINIISECSDKPSSLLDWFLARYDKKLAIYGDGMVPKNSQKLAFENTLSLELKCTHASSMKLGIQLIKNLK